MRARVTALLVVIAGASALLIALFLLLQKDERERAAGEDLKRRLDVLRSVPYTTLTPERVGPEKTGVVAYERGRAFDGYNLFCSGVSPEAFLMDMDGRIVHRWEYSTGRKRIWTWVHVIMLENGDIVVVDRYKNLLRLDWASNPVWIKEMEVHHDVIQLPDGSFSAIVREVKAHRGFDVRFAAIVHLSSDGEEIDRWSTYEHLDEIKRVFDQRSFLDTILDSIDATGEAKLIEKDIPGRVDVSKREGKLGYDYFHMNTITLLPDNAHAAADDRFSPGNLLICLRNVDQIAILDKDTKEILWAWGEGILEWPHYPTMLDDGNILVFDNGVKRKYSKVLELNPVTGAIEWEYVGDPPESFYTYEKGSAQRLPNGNTLICEGDRGRAFEVTEEGETVWEWLNPNTRRVRRVQVYRMMRVPPEDVDHLLRMQRKTSRSE